MGKRVEIEWRGVDHRLTVISVLAWFVRYALLTTLLTAVISGLASTAFASRASAAAQGCPETAPGAVSSGSPGAQQQLVPAGAVSLTLCRYRGLSDPNPSYVNQLVGSATLTDPQQLQLSADQFNALPPFPNGVFACPLDDGSSLLARFEYANSPPDEVLIRSTGCSSATNGYVTSSMMFSGGQELRTELQNLTGCASSIDYWLCNSDPVPPNPNPGVSTSNPNPTPSTQPPRATRRCRVLSVCVEVQHRAGAVSSKKSASADRRMGAWHLTESRSSTKPDGECWSGRSAVAGSVLASALAATRSSCSVTASRSMATSCGARRSLQQRAGQRRSCSNSPSRSCFRTEAIRAGKLRSTGASNSYGWRLS